MWLSKQNYKITHEFNLMDIFFYFLFWLANLPWEENPFLVHVHRPGHKVNPDFEENMELVALEYFCVCVFCFSGFLLL